MDKHASQMIDIIQMIIDNKLDNIDNIAVYEIVRVNENETYDVKSVYGESVIREIINSSPYNFVVGDMAVVMLIKNRQNNAMIIGKQNPSMSDNKYVYNNKLRGLVQTIIDDYDNVVKSVNGNAGDVAITPESIGAQESLVNEENIKSINGESILGEGSLNIPVVSASSTGSSTDDANYLEIDGKQWRTNGTVQVENGISAQGVTYKFRISTTDAGRSGYITFVV